MPGRDRQSQRHPGQGAQGREGATPAEPEPAPQPEDLPRVLPAEGMVGPAVEGMRMGRQAIHAPSQRPG